MSQKIVYETPEGGIAVIHPTGEVSIANLVNQVVPYGTAYEIVESETIPTDRLFRGAWKATNVGIESTTTEIYEDVGISKSMAHDMRRAKRNELFAPYDEIIMKQIPGDDAVAAEAARAVIRTQFAGIQSAIEDAVDVVGIKSTLVDRGIVSIVGFGSTAGVGSTTP